MPNGGSDCCGTCPFNRKNRGEAGYAHARDPGPDHCEIRDLAVGNSFYTYCANHPSHNRDRIRVPIGPVFRHSDNGGREIWQPGPDTPEVRDEVLKLLVAATPEPVEDYPAGLSLIEAALVHAGELADARFATDLDRIRRFPGFTDGRDDRPFARNPARSAALAAEALARILPPDTILPFASDTARAVAAEVARTGDPGGLPVLADALEEAGCSHPAVLGYLRSPAAAAQTPTWVVDVILGRAVAPPG